MRSYTFTIFKTTPPMGEAVPLTENGVGIEHREIASYEGLTSPPWVPPEGSFFRFRDPTPPGRPADHREVTGYVDQIVTCFYGTGTTIEIYLRDKTR